MRPLLDELHPVPDPLDLLARVRGASHVAWLDAAADHDDLGRVSVLAWDPVATVTLAAAQWAAQRDALRTTLGHVTHEPEGPAFQGGWIGWLGYELGAAFDAQPIATRNDLDLPDGELALYDLAVVWDHATGRAWLVSTGIDADGLPDATRAATRRAAARATLAQSPVPGGARTAPSRARQGGALHAFHDAPPGLVSDFTAESYRAAVRLVIDGILEGEIFQANLSWRATAPFAGDPLALYQAMRRRAPAALGAFLEQPTRQVLSVSPERFLAFDATTRRVETRPIKGTRPRDADPARDAALAADLAGSAKDRAENVMIVDLLRNDLARVAETGTVAVPALCRLESHAAVHHLTSIVTAVVRPEHDALDLLAATFPGGSITGAPKLRAMAMLATLEPVIRGPYCGAIGWLGLDGSLALSVAIRTLTVTDGTVAIHAGGGITALSEPIAEYEETLDKARALVAAVAEVRA
ncbi:MAG TPA: aminodeoxychorismate synthase component I [Gemmatimonadales bacterium]|nr:aminodeoxychorismate synthase component I [Gemmatimonadales bacterium]